MPQLDRIIIFTQIFWLFFIFIISYIILTHYFFPLFLKSLKSRRLVIEENIREADKIYEQFVLNQNILAKSLNEGLSIVKFIYSSEFLSVNGKKESSSLSLVDKNLVKVLLNTMLYCDKKVLNCISLNSKIFNSSCNTR